MSTQQDGGGGFFDQKTILAIVLVFGFWWLWQKHLADKYPDAYKKKASNTVDKTVDKGVSPKSTMASDTTVAQNGESTAGVSSPAIAQDSASPQSEEKLTSYEDSFWQFKISSKGMGLKDVVLKTHTNRDNSPVKIGASHVLLPFETLVNSTRLDFDVEKTGENSFRGVAKWQGGRIVKTMIIKPKNYAVEIEIRGENLKAPLPSLKTHMADSIRKTESSSFLIPSFERQEFYVNHSATDDREMITPEDNVAYEYKNVVITSLSTHYFNMAVIDSSKVMPEAEVKSDPGSGLAYANLLYKPGIGTENLEVNYKIFAGPKDINILRSVDQALVNVIDFGFFGFIAKPLLSILKWFHSLVGNWGWAIVFLTLLVRGILLPLNIKAFRSMKKMQLIQPQMKAIREKYKDDPKMAQQHTMALMRDNKVNPLGGCWPTLLQIPVFFALYQVLGQSIELYQAPFVLWISDLSVKDPFYVLPILMGVTMFFQQKLTPTTMDPTQKKVFMIMPIFFTFLMLTLPSGLTLYIFVSTLFGIFQQYLTLREKKVVPATGRAQA